jgi:hypothetical protein
MQAKETEMHIEGGCHCGKITYQAEVDPDTAGICHCTDCQTFSGSAFRTVVQAPKSGFRILTGEPRIYVKTAESGNKRAQAFCADCGTHLYATAAVDPQVYGLRIGTARQRSQLPPQRQIWCQSAQPWAMQLQTLARFPKQPG